jgi:TRAP-type transport system small permease protein
MHVPPATRLFMTATRSAFLLIERLRNAQLRLAALALVLMMLITTADVVLRYTLNRPIRGSYDLVECMLVVFVFHGMAAGFLRRQNIVIDVLDTFLSERMLRVLIRLADVLSIACLLLVGWAMTTPALQAYNYGDRKIELNLPIYILWIAAFAGIAGTLVCAIGAALTPPAKSEDGPEA